MKPWLLSLPVIACVALLRAWGDGSSVPVFGHRGARAELPENTLAAFQRALSLGGGIELDVRESLDRVLVVHHDAVLNQSQCKQKRGAPIPRGTRVDALTLAELRQFDCGARTDPHFPQQQPARGQKIPTLKRVLALLMEHNGHAVIEIKRDEDDPLPVDEVVRDVISAIHRARAQDHVVVQSFSAEVMRALRDQDALLHRALLIPPRFSDDPIAAARAVGAQTVAPAEMGVDTDFVARAHAADLMVMPWSPNMPERWRELLAAGVDAVITDDPRGLLAFLRGEQL